MTDHHPRSSHSIGHPAPGRQQVGDVLLVFSFALVPVAWSVQLGAITALAGLACIGPHEVSTVSSQVDWSGPAIRWINLVALALGLVGIGLSMINMRRARQAAAPPPGGEDIKGGEGRVHWMAFGGLFVASVCMISIIANSIPIFWSGLCPV